MKKIMKKNQIIITSLAILIAVAGYLNFADVDLGFKDKETSTDSSSILDDVDYDLFHFYSPHFIFITLILWASI